MTRQGQLFVVSAPSGTGKTTVVERLVGRVPDIRMSCSFTSRTPRVGEVDGIDYHFVSRSAFEAMRDDGAFLEHASVFENYYGTSKAETDSWLARGQDVVLVIDVQGARQVRAMRRTVSVFIMPPSPEVLEQRLRGRSRDNDASIARRLAVARSEIECYEHYDYVIVNDDLETCVGTLAAVVVATRATLAANRSRAQGIAERFGVGSGSQPADAEGRSLSSNSPGD